MSNIFLPKPRWGKYDFVSHDRLCHVGEPQTGTLELIPDRTTSGNCPCTICSIQFSRAATDI